MVPGTSNEMSDPVGTRDASDDFRRSTHRALVRMLLETLVAAPDRARAAYAHLRPLLEREAGHDGEGMLPCIERLSEQDDLKGQIELALAAIRNVDSIRAGSWMVLDLYGATLLAHLKDLRRAERPADPEVSSAAHRLLEEIRSIKQRSAGAESTAAAT